MEEASSGLADRRGSDLGLLLDGHLARVDDFVRAAARDAGYGQLAVLLGHPHEPCEGARRGGIGEEVGGLPGLVGPDTASGDVPALSVAERVWVAHHRPRRGACVDLERVGAVLRAAEHMVVDRVACRAEGVSAFRFGDRDIDDGIDDPRLVVGDVDPGAGPEPGHGAEAELAGFVFAHDDLRFVRGLAHVGGAEGGVADLLERAERLGCCPRLVAYVERAVLLPDRVGGPLARSRLHRVVAGAGTGEEQGGKRDGCDRTEHEFLFLTRGRFVLNFKYIYNIFYYSNQVIEA